MEIIKNDSGLLKHATDIQTVLNNGYSLNVDFGKQEEDNYESKEYYIKEDDLLQVHRGLARFITDFRLPIKGDVIDDGTGLCTVYEVWVDYGHDTPVITVFFI